MHSKRGTLSSEIAREPQEPTLYPRYNTQTPCTTLYPAHTRPVVSIYIQNSERWRNNSAVDWSNIQSMDVANGVGRNTR
jgi:hypothetical protein